MHKIYNFHEAYFVYFFICCLCLWCHIQEIIARNVDIKVGKWLMA